MKTLLTTIVKHPLLEARWLNTLSLLEFIGARKISKTVCQDYPSRDILAHYADEVRHANVFKQLGDTVAGFPYEDTLCTDAAVSYFQLLDKTLSEWLGHVSGVNNAYQNYLLVTRVIERRAMRLYPLYKSLTCSDAVRAGLGGIIHEEAGHLHTIEDAMSKGGMQDDAFPHGIEQTLFATFESSLRGEIDRSHLAA